MRVRRVVAIAVAVLMALTGCAPAPVPPTYAEVLDGPEFAAQQEAAAKAAKQVTSEVGQLPEVSEAAVVEFAACGWGQNNAKVKDGYRTRCSINRTVYLVWDGDFTGKRDAIAARLRQSCTEVTTNGDGGSTPGREFGFILGPGYECGPGLSIALAWASGVGASRDGEIGNLDCGSESIRCRRVSSTVEVVKKLSTRKWVAAVAANAIFYVDEVH